MWDLVPPLPKGGPVNLFHNSFRNIIPLSIYVGFAIVPSRPSVLQVAPFGVIIQIKISTRGDDVWSIPRFRVERGANVPLETSRAAVRSVALAAAVA